MADFLKQTSLACHKTIYVKDWHIFCTEGPDIIDYSLFHSQKKLIISRISTQFNKSVTFWLQILVMYESQHFPSVSFRRALYMKMGREWKGLFTLGWIDQLLWLSFTDTSVKKPT